MIVRVFVHQGVIKRNREQLENDPPIWVKWYDDDGTLLDDKLGHDVEVMGPGRFRYNREAPFEQNVTLWFETTANVVVKSLA